MVVYNILYSTVWTCWRVSDPPQPQAQRSSLPLWRAARGKRKLELALHVLLEFVVMNLVELPSAPWVPCWSEAHVWCSQRPSSCTGRQRLGTHGEVMDLRDWDCYGMDQDAPDHFPPADDIDIVLAGQSKGLPDINAEELNTLLKDHPLSELGWKSGLGIYVQETVGVSLTWYIQCFILCNIRGTMAFCPELDGVSPGLFTATSIFYEIWPSRRRLMLPLLLISYKQ